MSKLLTPILSVFCMLAANAAQSDDANRLKIDAQTGVVEVIIDGDSDYEIYRGNNIPVIYRICYVAGSSWQVNLLVDNGNTFSKHLEQFTCIDYGGEIQNLVVQNDDRFSTATITYQKLSCRDQCAMQNN